MAWRVSPNRFCESNWAGYRERWRWDLNPRSPQRLTRFRGAPVRPLRYSTAAIMPKGPPALLSRGQERQSSEDLGFSSPGPEELLN